MNESFYASRKQVRVNRISKEKKSLKKSRALRHKRKLFKTIFMHNRNVFVSSSPAIYCLLPNRQHFRKHFSLPSNVMQYYIIIYSMHFHSLSLSHTSFSHSLILLCNNIHTWTSHAELMPFILLAVLPTIFSILTLLTPLFIKWKLYVLLQFPVHVTLITF